MAGEWVSGQTETQLIENNQGVDSSTLKRKLEKEAHREEDDRENEEPTVKKPMVEKVNQTWRKKTVYNFHCRSAMSAISNATTTAR